MEDRADEGNVVSPFGNLPRDGSHTPIQIANSVIAEDATATPVTSPLSGTTAVTLNIPKQAIAIQLIHDATSQTSTATFNGQGGTLDIVANQTVRMPCAGEAFQTLTVTPGAADTYVSFVFEIV